MSWNSGQPVVSSSLDSEPIRENFEHVFDSLNTHASSSTNPHSVTLDQACDQGNTTDQVITVNASGSIFTSLLVPEDLQVGETIIAKRVNTIRYADQFSSIQAAIDDLPEGGGTVFIASGSHSISSTITIPDNVCLIGEGIGITTIQLVSGSNTSVITGSLHEEVGLYNKNICIKNLTVDGNKDNQGDEAIFHLFGIWFSNTTKAVDTLLIQNVEVKDCKEHGIGVVGDNIRITECIVSDCKWNNITIRGYNSIIDSVISSGSGDCAIEITTDSKESVVANCVCYIDAGGNTGILIRGAEGITVVGNTIVGSGSGIGISVNAPSGESCERISITANTIKYADYGIYLTAVGSAKTISVVDNVCSYNIYRGIRLKNITHSIVSNNIVYNNGKDDDVFNAGIFVEDSTYNLITGNCCFDDQGAKTQKRGIREHGTSDYNRIIGNDFRGNSVGEMYIIGANTITQNYENNRFEFSDELYVNGDFKADGDIIINEDESDADAILHFKTSGSVDETLKWDKTDNRFEFSNDLHFSVGAAQATMSSTGGWSFAATNGYFHFYTSGGQVIYFDCGGLFYWRDVDGGNVNRMTLDSSNGNLWINGNFYSDGDIIIN
ncbi:MAG: right-handed parallel beta-helix repeat-containing protein, partial [Candidatus Cloacimonetes bacterium]|nr:right-handed parallel beta-helix repeat-containing protein [Candidatus Cloacimonadota bacterium]